jgi:hypothetical protein
LRQHPDYTWSPGLGYGYRIYNGQQVVFTKCSQISDSNSGAWTITEPSCFRSTNNGYDGWGNNPEASASGALQRFTLSEQQYSFLLGEGINTTITKTNGSHITLAEIGSRTIFFVQGDGPETVVDLDILEAPIGTNVRLIASNGTADSIIVYRMPGSMSIEDHRDLVATNWADFLTEIKATKQSGIYRYNDEILQYNVTVLATLNDATATENRDYIEINRYESTGTYWMSTSQNFISWMHGRLAVSKIDFGLNATLDNVTPTGQATGAGDIVTRYNELQVQFAKLINRLAIKGIIYDDF